MKRSVFVCLVGGAMAACSPATPSGSPDPPAPASATSPPISTPVPTASATPACIASRGEWVEFTYEGVAVRGEVPARIYLPPCYDESGRSYPVAFFFHGKPYTEEQWIELGLEALFDPDGQGTPAFPGIAVLARLPEPLFSGSDGGPGSYEQEFFEGLLASVEDRFRTLPSGSDRAVVGISRGAVWALELSFRSPDRIEHVIALSPALAVNYAREAYDPLRLAAAADRLPGVIFLAAGEDDWARRATAQLADVLAARGAAVDLRLVPGAHADATWRSLLPEVIGLLREAFSEAGRAGEGEAGIEGKMDSRVLRRP